MRSPPTLPPPNPVGTETSAAPPSASGGASLIDKQLARLYGESVFGTWLDPAQVMSAGRRQRRRGSWGKRAFIFLLSTVALTAGIWLTQRGFSRQAAQDRAQVAKDVAAFLNDGELERLAQFVSILSPPGERLQASDPYLDLIVRAEAALYRYHDASPARLARIEPYLSTAGMTPSRLLARLTVASNPERSPSYDTLKSLRESFANDPELWTLMASVEEGRDGAAARANWEHSFKLGPLWLPHRYQQCRFEAQLRNVEAVARITRHMAKVAPDSPWTRLALDLPGADRASVANPGKQMSQVAQFHEQLARVFESLRTGGSPAGRRQALERAFAAVHDGASFVLDAFDWLMAAKAKDLATEITSFDAWPRGNSVARTLVDRLQLPAHGQDAPPTAGARVGTSAVDAPSSPSTGTNKKVASKTSKAKKPGAGAKAKKKRVRSKKRGGHSPG